MTHKAYEHFANDMESLGLESIVAECKPTLQQMEQTEQDKVWHAEGDVLTHTNMVVESLKQEVVYLFNIDRASVLYKYLLLSCWFHDFGKPARKMWNEKKQRNTFIQHENTSAQMWRVLAWKHRLDFQLTENVFSLVKYHGEPSHLIKNNALEKTIRQFAEKVCPRNVFLVEQADYRGRITNERSMLLDLLDQFLYYNDRLKISDYNNVDLIAGKMKRVSSFTDFHFNKRTLILPVAVPGTGKTYIREGLQTIYDLTVISPDDIRNELFGTTPYDASKNSQVYGVAFKRLSSAFEQNAPYIYMDAQNATIKDRERVLELAKQFNYNTSCLWFDKPLEVSLKQNGSRTRVVDPQYIVERVGNLQIPLDSEFDSVFLVGHLN